MPHLAIYARVSSEEQAREGYSIANQLRACHLYTELHELGTEVVEYIEPGLTGRDTNRKAFQTLLAALRSREVTHLVVWRLNRLHRSLRDFLDTLEVLERTETGLHSVTEHVDTKSATGRLLINVLMSFHAFESDKLSEDVTAGMRQKVREGGWCNHAPTGYQLIGSELMPDPEKAAVIRQVFASAAEGGSLRELARLAGLTAQALPHILRNPVYAGYVFEHQKVLPPLRLAVNLEHTEGVHRGRHEALVDPETWDRVQLTRERHSTRTPDRSRHLLSGLLRCGCGAACEIVHPKPTVRSYRCINRCMAVSVRKLEWTLLSYLDGMRDDPDFLSEVKAQLNTEHREARARLFEKMPGVKRELARATRKEERWRRLFLDEKITEGEYLPTAEQLAGARMAWETEAAFLEKARTEAMAAEGDFLAWAGRLPHLPRVSEVWDEWEPSEKAVLLRELVSALRMSKEGLVVMGFQGPAVLVPWMETSRWTTVYPAHDATSQTWVCSKSKPANRLLHSANPGLLVVKATCCHGAASQRHQARK